MLGVPSGPGLEDWMTLTFRLERLEGTPADPPSDLPEQGGFSED
jgi:hypothetical protein